MTMIFGAGVKENVGALDRMGVLGREFLLLLSFNYLFRISELKYGNVLAMWSWVNHLYMRFFMEKTGM